MNSKGSILSALIARESKTYSFFTHCVVNPNYFLVEIMASCSPRLYQRKSRNDATKTFKPQTSMFTQRGGQKRSDLWCSHEAHFFLIVQTESVSN